ncbi:hypothetical protein [Psychromonas sp. MME2]|uniref:hypothetical protein n=1 Tax=unclassified Psychromonas TaxID=2614957 RepID=UPI00339BFB80
MYEENLTLIVEKGHAAYEWAKRQSDAVSAFGHIGTHIDCYDSEPEKNDYEVEVVTVNCTEKMPSVDDLVSLDMSGKALILFTGNVENNNYGTPEYGSMDTTLYSDVLDFILLTPPLFIVIDSYGIGAHGDEHIGFDKRCESKGCFVIENVNLSLATTPSLRKLKISFDKLSKSTGNRCQVIAVYP